MLQKDLLTTTNRKALGKNYYQLQKDEKSLQQYYMYTSKVDIYLL